MAFICSYLLRVFDFAVAVADVAGVAGVAVAVAAHDN